MIVVELAVMSFFSCLVGMVFGALIYEWYIRNTGGPTGYA